MTGEPNIVIIGAGSASFGLENLTGIMAQKSLKGAKLSLVDINENNLKAVHALASRINNEWKANMEIISTTDRSEVLSDADFVVLSVAVDREETWIKDHEIAKKYGIMHYAENGGPGSFGHTARGLAFIMPILYDIHDLTPDSWLINFTNPIPRIGYAAQYANVNYIGLCHQYWHGYGILGRYLAKDLGIDENLHLEVTWTDESQNKLNKFAIAASQEYEMKIAGLNHFIWMLDINRRNNGENIYHLVREEAGSINANFEPLTQHLFKIFDLLPVAGDSHIAEYLPYTYTKEKWDKYRIQLYDFDRGRKQRKTMWEKINAIIVGKPLDLYPNIVERGDAIIAEMLTNNNAYEQAVNIINNGAISNLPNDSIVEVPAIINSSKVTGVRIGNLPESIAALCQKEISIAKLITRASIEGDRDLAVQAFALMLDDLKIVEKLLDEYLIAHKKYLPQFFT